MSINFDEKNLKEFPKDEDDDQNFIKKDEPENEEKKSTVKEGEEVQGVIWKLKNLVFPKNTQQRNLAREVGGLEAEKRKESSEADVWDGRSEEVDKMGSTDVFNTTGMRSVVWKKKKERLEMAKHALEAAAALSEINPKKTEVGSVKNHASRVKDSQHHLGGSGLGR